MRNPGKIYQVTCGTFKDMFAVAIDKQQEKEILIKNKLKVKIYVDKEMKREMSNGSNAIIGIDKLTLIGFID